MKIVSLTQRRYMPKNHFSSVNSTGDIIGGPSCNSSGEKS